MRGPASRAVTPGTQVDIAGTTDAFLGSFELGDFTPTLAVVANDGFVGVPAPVTVTAADFANGSATAEGLESERVRLDCVTFVNPPKVCGNGLTCPGGVADCGGGPCELLFRGSWNYTVTDGNNTVTVRTPPFLNGDIILSPIPCDAVSLTGIFSQMDFEAPTDVPPANTGYRLLLNSAADVGTAACPDPLRCGCSLRVGGVRRDL